MTTRKASGFSLIELVTVVAIVAILAVIALPSFADQLRKSRRSEALGALQDQQLRQERWRVDNPAYSTALPFSSSNHYTFAAAATATGYTLTATPSTSSQAKDSCGTLTMASTNGVITKTPAGCW